MQHAWKRTHVIKTDVSGKIWRKINIEKRKKIYRWCYTVAMHRGKQPTFLREKFLKRTDKTTQHSTI